MSKISDALKKAAKERLEKIDKPSNEVQATPEKNNVARGLAALIGDKASTAYAKPVSVVEGEGVAQGQEVVYLELGKVKPGKLQPREKFDDQKLQELIASVKEQGVLQPILVRKIDTGYEIIAGERRYRAAKSLALGKIPALIKNVNDEDALVISLMENLQREGLNPIEEAHAFEQLISQFNLSQDSIAKALGKDKATVSNVLRLLKLPEDIQKTIIKENISLGHAKVLLGVENLTKQRLLCQQVISNGLSVRELENLVNTSIPTKKRKAALATVDPYIANFERALQLALGTKVKIQAHRKRGKIIIEYYSPADLERVINVLKKCGAAKA